MFKKILIIQVSLHLISLMMPTVDSRMSSSWPKDIEPKSLYKYISNYWVQLNISNSFDPFDGKNTKFLMRFDANPDWKNVDLFPHHKHYYVNNKGSKASEFAGSFGDLIEFLQNIIETETGIVGPL